MKLTIAATVKPLHLPKIGKAIKFPMAHIAKIQIHKAKNGFVVKHFPEGIQSPRKYIFPTSSGLIKHVERTAAVMKSASPKIRMGKPLG